MTQSSVLSPQSSPSPLAHVSPRRVLLAVWAALIILTVATVSAAQVDLGSWNLWIALGIATLKASLVALFFMHLRYDRPIHGIVFLSTLFFLALFIGLALMDTLTYHPDLIPGFAPALGK